MDPMPPRFCSACGTELVLQTLEGRPRGVCPGCDVVAYQNPAPAAGAVIRRGHSVLLCRRAIEPFLGTWGIPAGYQEYDETIETTAAREVREETGLVVRLTSLIDVFSGQDDPRKPSVLVVFEAEEIDGELEPGSDCDEVGFFPLDALPRSVGFRHHRLLLERLATGAERTW